MDKQPILITALAVLAGIVYYVSSVSTTLSPAQAQISYLYRIWTGLSITVAIIVIGLIAVSIARFRVKK
ncbi:MAG: hypothetical protein HZB68_02950 [Candidatus Aenigmarchaeota archaeon]|nr:hypothetical protein [Candidatus Aenigmarchaeota archaeon]